MELSEILSSYENSPEEKSPLDLREALRTAKEGSLALSIDKTNSGFFYNGIIMIGERRKCSLFDMNNLLYIGHGCDSDLQINAQRVSRNLVLIGQGRLQLNEESTRADYEIRAYSIEDVYKVLEKTKSLKREKTGAQKVPVADPRQFYRRFLG